MKKVAVIIGAGASRGASLPAAETNPAWRPPLAEHLFGEHIYGGPYWPILSRYQGAKDIQSKLLLAAKSSNYVFEDSLRQYAEDPHYQDSFKEVPGYLRDLIYEVQEH